MIGESIGPYRVLERVGAGGMGEVYRARDTRLDRSVAIKLLPADLSTDLDRRARFEREARAVAALAHPHICTLYDIGTHEGATYLVMEHLAGETLADRLTKGPLTLAQALEIGAQVAEALDAAHKHGIVHRDLKPGNVMLTTGGTGRSGVPSAKLLDFGLAKLTAHGERPALATEVSAPTRAEPVTARGTVLGTLPYMAPEQLEGKEADPRTDLWALGAILCEMVTGARAFAGDSSVSLIGEIMHAEPRALAARQSLTPPALERLVRRCLAKHPDQRWDSAHDVADELRWIAQTTGTNGLAAPTAPSRGRWWGFVAAGLAVISAATAGWLGWTLGRRSVAAPVPQPRHFQLALPPSAPIAFAGPAPIGIWQRAVEVSRDGRTVAYIAKKDETTALAARHLDTGMSREFPGTEGAYFPFFSPDGEWIAFFVGGELRKVSVGGGTPSVVATGLVVATGATWLSDGRILVATDEGRKPVWVAAAGGPIEAIPNPCGADLSCGVMDPRVLPGAEWAIGMTFNGHLSVLSLKGDGIYLLSTSGPVRVERADPRSVLRGWSPRYLTSGHLVFMSDQGTELQAMRFDPATLRPTGPVFPIHEGIRREQLYTAGQFAVSDEGTLVYAPGANASLVGLAWVAASGRREPVAFPRGVYGSLSLNAGKTVAAFWRENAAAAGTADVVVLEVATGRPVRSIAFEGLRPGLLGWAPDGGFLLSLHNPVRWKDNWRQLAFTSVTADRATEQAIADFSQLVTALSPNGDWGAFTGDQDSATLRSVRNSKAPPVSIAPASWKASFSPDSRWLAFSVDGPTNKIVVIPVPYDGRRFEVASDEGDQPRWFPDGRRLAYKRGRQFMVIDLTLGEHGIEPGRPRPFAEGPFPRVSGWSYDIGADGRVLTFINADEPSAPHLNVITDFPELVRRKAPEAPSK